MILYKQTNIHQAFLRKKLCSKLLSHPVKVQTSNASNSSSAVNTNTSPIQQISKSPLTNQKLKEGSADQTLAQSDETETVILVIN